MLIPWLLSLYLTIIFASNIPQASTSPPPPTSDTTRHLQKRATLPNFHRERVSRTEGITFYNFHSISYSGNAGTTQPSANLAPHIPSFYTLYETIKTLALDDGGNQRDATSRSPPTWHLQIGRAKFEVESQAANDAISWANIGYIAARSLRNNAGGCPLGSEYIVDIEKLAPPSAGILPSRSGHVATRLQGRITVSLEAAERESIVLDPDAGEAGEPSGPVRRPLPLGVGGRMPPTRFDPRPSPSPAPLPETLSGVD